MFIEGCISSNKTDILIDKYVELINNGVNTSEILVLVQNSSLKNNFQNKVLEKINQNIIEKPLIHSFFSLVYNTIYDNWAFLEDRNIFDNPIILPNLSGLEISQFILKDILKEVKFKGYNSRMSLLQQIFRRYSLIVQNNLTPKEVENRAKILKEGFSDEASMAINKMLRKTLELRGFDYIRQCLLFNFIYKNTSYFANIKYLFIDDADECTPICIDFIEYISKNIKDFYIAIDPLGSSRCGYLSADKNNYQKLLKFFGKSEIKILQPKKNSADILFNNIHENEQKTLENFSYLSFSKRHESIDYVASNIDLMLKKGIKPCEISIITPNVDEMLKFNLAESLKNVNLLYLTGNEKLIQNKFVHATITILKLNSELKKTLSEFDIRVILSEFLQIPIKYCEKILQKFQKEKVLIPYEFTNSEYSQKYEGLLSLIDKLRDSEEKLSEQILEIYNNLFDIGEQDINQINKFNFFVKQIKDFESIFGNNFNKRKSDIILQIENSIIAENPYSVLEIDNNDLVISTPQKIIDNQIITKYQFWLDISNSDWIKSDTGPLYNAWVFQKDWDKSKYTIEDNINLSNDKNARVLRKLALCAKNHIYCTSSLFDSNGVENYGAFEKYIITNEDPGEKITPKSFNITPRQDQKPVLEYKSGYMGISAVPGAGKTTILLALIVKLLGLNINPEHIFVLTYMDSAARNFRDRIKNLNNNSSKIPNISTIHGLALRILKENGNFEKLGLSEDFEICDDAQRNRILSEISNRMKIKTKLAEDYDRAVSAFKIEYGVLPQNSQDAKIIQFADFYNQYQNKLKEFNLIDYDDMLTGAVKILKQNPDILNHYQNICEYIIEDEAQDSSSVQQDLISLLSGKHKNVIRCGDINQSITSTFSNSDVLGFKKFLTAHTNVKMNSSQRCAKNIWEFANKLVNKSMEFQDTKEAFYEMYITGVEGKNPADKDSLHAKILETPAEEKIYVVKKIKSILAKNPSYTIGVLLRNNYQIAKWQNIIENEGFDVITRNQCLEQKSIFKAIFSAIKIIINPFDNGNLANNYDTLADLGCYKKGQGLEIAKYENPFIKIDCDNINNVSLEQFYWDVNHWLSLCYLTPDELIVRIAKDLHILKTEIDKCNIHLLSTLIKRICNANNSLEYTVKKLEELSKKANLSGFKFFSEEDEDDKKSLEGKVQIMTIHKSKGDEFNVVFIPELTEKNLPLKINTINLKSSDIIEKVKTLTPNYKQKTTKELKQEILNENLRLLYVAITRAKNRLYLTSSNKEQNFNKLKDAEINSAFSIISEEYYE